jgi:hypothetical protein
MLRISNKILLYLILSCGFSKGLLNLNNSCVRCNQFYKGLDKEPFDKIILMLEKFKG